MDVQRRLEVVEEENHRLRERIAVLENALMGTELLPVEWRLTDSEARVFGVLVNRELATKDAIMVALYQHSDVDAAEIKIVDVYVCKIRKKLRPFGINIKTRWGVGYFLEPGDRNQFRKAKAA